MKVFFLIAIGLIMLGCNKNLPCNDGHIIVNFIDYTSEELDTLIIKKFTNTIPQEEIFSKTLIKDSTMGFRVSNDTLQLSTFFNSDFFTQSYNWQIIIPSVNKTINITSIDGDRRTEKVGTFSSNTYCYNRLFSCFVDGVKITFPPIVSSTYLNGTNTQIYIYK
ncbi:MAG: hypothetical protein MUE72_04165 [Chitinophagaceae bacterium]|jgi:hypothetical protein|nr:hypothetical protein [Chitinophagaceae bacterium]